MSHLLRHKVNRWRDRVAWRMANFILRTVGTKTYSDTLQMTICTGMGYLDVLAKARSVEEIPAERYINRKGPFGI